MEKYDTEWNPNNLIKWVNYLLQTQHSVKVRNHLTLDRDDFSQFCLLKIFKYTDFLNKPITKQNKAYISVLVKNEVNDKYNQNKFIKQGKNNTQATNTKHQVHFIDEVNKNEPDVERDRPLYDEFQNILTDSEIKLLELYAYDKTKNKQEVYKIIEKIRKGKTWTEK